MNENTKQKFEKISDLLQTPPPSLLLLLLPLLLPFVKKMTPNSHVKTTKISFITVTAIATTETIPQLLFLYH